MKKPILLTNILMGLLLVACSSKSGDVAEFDGEGSLVEINQVALEAGTGEVILNVSSPREPKYNVFKLTEPDRIVVDLIDAKLAGDVSRQLAGLGDIQSVNIQEIKDSLSSLVRIEMVMASSANYVAMVDGSNLVVKVLQPGMEQLENEFVAMSPPAPLQEQEASSENELAPLPDPQLEIPLEEGNALEALPEINFPEPAPTTEFDIVPAPLPVIVDTEEEKEESVAEAEMAPEPEITPEITSEPAPLVEEEQIEVPSPAPSMAANDPLPIIVEPLPSPQAPEVAPMPEQIQTQEIPTSGLTVGTSLLTDIETKVYTGRRVSLEFQDAEIQDVIRLVAEVSKLNVIVSDDVKGAITLKLVDVPWDQALDIILTAKGLDKVQYGNILRVAPIEQLKKEREIALANDRAAKQLEPLKLKLININYATSDEMAGRIKNLLSERGSVDTDSRTNTLIIRDIKENLSRIENLVNVLDTQTPQVRIESRIVQANDNFRRNIGVRWGPTLKLDADNNHQTDWQFPNNINVGTAPASAAAFTSPAATALSDFAVDALPGSSTGSSLGFRIGSVNDIFNLDLQLSYAQTKDMARIISRPSVTVLDNKTARIIQGSRIPFLSSSSEGSNVQFQEAGIEIAVTPQITNDGSVLLEVSTRSNEPGSEAVGGNPIINIREANTEMLVKSGRTAVLGGVFKTSKTQSEVGVPGLMDVPILGWLFKGKSGGQTLEELLIFITPYVLTDAREAITTPSSSTDTLEP